MIPILLVLAVAVCYYVFWFEREWMKGVTLNPHQVDEIQIVKRDGELLREEIISVHNRAWVRDILSQMKRSTLISKSFPMNYELLKGETVKVILNDGRSTKASADIYLGEYDGELQREARMVISGRNIYSVSETLLQQLIMELDDYKKQSTQVEIVLDAWKPLVIVDGQPYFAHYLGDGWGNGVSFQEGFTVENQLPDHIKYEDRSNVTDLLIEKAGTYPLGTMIYKADGYYFVQNEKEPDTWSVLLPLGQAAHSAMSDQPADVQFWHSERGRTAYEITIF